MNEFLCTVVHCSVEFAHIYEKLLVKQRHIQHNNKENGLTSNDSGVKWLGSIKCMVYQGKRAITTTYGPEQSTISRYSYTYFIPGTPIIRHFYFSQWHGVAQHQIEQNRREQNRTAQHTSQTNSQSANDPPTDRPTNQPFISKQRAFKQNYSRSYETHRSHTMRNANERK